VVVHQEAAAIQEDQDQEEVILKAWTHNREEECRKTCREEWIPSSSEDILKKAAGVGLRVVLVAKDHHKEQEICSEVLLLIH